MIADNTKPKRTLRKIAKLAERPYVPSSDSPYTELRQLVRQHKAITRAAVAIDNMSSDKTNLETGEKMKCRLPEDVQVDLQETAKRQRQKASKLETAMHRELRKLPVWNEFLKLAMPSGIITGAYLLSEIDITICNKPSQLRRFLGLAVIGGHLERRRKGEKNHYNAELRTRLWLWATAVYKGCFRDGERVKTSKYMQVWIDWIHRMETSERISGREKNPVERVTGSDETMTWERVQSANATSRRERESWIDGTDADERADKRNETVDTECASEADKTMKPERAYTRDDTNTPERKRWSKTNGWVKSADLLALDLYVIWRTLEGLPVWPTYLEGVVRGAEHKTGRLIPNAPRVLTMDEAREMIGDLGPHALAEAAE